jgi:hypothetical protein
LTPKLSSVREAALSYYIVQTVLSTVIEVQTGVQLGHIRFMTSSVAYSASQLKYVSGEARRKYHIIFMHVKLSFRAAAIFHILQKEYRNKSCIFVEDLLPHKINGP